ncbi:Tetratricopeptide repeat-containing domain,Suppressor of forked,Tetratricopeptide-like helical [Cinara cedri]|uniref:Tetratricopeptide repeat-containing domain,Suppressor of forked,Tetratricopeptide-like helical n=1 Tax=Cinara cedri TaxID=506608 RepID=A0A5E4N6T8_9HEMI|nr:Tetratricopeptide repeat-containing domain,Suppressor of forked,Tetratricopeptide-like helical [Cinara cedri]
MNKRPKKVENMKPILINQGIGFEWNITPNYFNKNNSDSDESDREQSVEPNKKKVRKINTIQRQEKQKQEELRLRKLEEELIKIETNPQNADHFDRLVLSNPNSSFIWIKYMACHLQATEVDKARAVAKKALSTIDTKEEQEKLNIWIALLNLENLYGTKESFKQTMDEALRSNDEYQIYIKILDIFAESNKLKELEELVTKVNKKFRDSMDAYLHCATVYFKLNKCGKARFILQKALSSLPAKSHVTMISRFALIENNDGSAEEAQTLFEQVLTSYPSRIDVWSIYVDMLIKSNRIDLARHALERATIQKLAPKKMKSLFNKWMMLEEKHGTADSVDNVKESMNNYVALVLNNKKN